MAVSSSEPVALPVQRHVESCLRCQAELARYRRMLRGLQLLRTQYFEPTPGLLAGTLATITAAGERRAVTSVLTKKRLAYAGAVAGAVAAAGTTTLDQLVHDGLTRTFRVVLDLITVKFLVSYVTRPMHVFGSAGLVSIGLGSCIGLALVDRRLRQELFELIDDPDDQDGLVLGPHGHDREVEGEEGHRFVVLAQVRPTTGPTVMFDDIVGESFYQPLMPAMLERLEQAGLLAESDGDPAKGSKAIKNYVKAAGKGILKVMSKMGISTVASYRGAQVFEAIGLERELADEYFTGTTSRLGGIGLAGIAERVRFLGRRSDTAAIFQALDVYLLSSHTEAFMGGGWNESNNSWSKPNDFKERYFKGS